MSREDPPGTESYEELQRRVRLRLARVLNAPSGVPLPDLDALLTQFEDCWNELQLRVGKAEYRLLNPQCTCDEPGDGVCRVHARQILDERDDHIRLLKAEVQTLSATNHSIFNERDQLRAKLGKLRDLAADYRSWTVLDDTDRQRNLRAAERIEAIIGEDPSPSKRRALKDLLRIGDWVDTSEEQTHQIADIRHDAVLTTSGKVIGYQDILLPIRGRSSLTEPVG